MDRALLGLVVAAVLAGCGGGKSVIRTPVEISPPFEFGDVPKRLWSARVESWAEDADLVLAADETHLYVPGRQALSAFARDSGKVRWVSEVGEISGGLRSSQDLLVASLFSGDIIALAKTDGSQRWNTFAAGEVLAPLAQTSRRLFAWTNNGRLLSLDVTSGEVQWVVENTTPSLSLRGTAGPVPLLGRVFYVDDSCKAHMVSSSDGSPIWERVLVVPEGSNEIEQLVDADSQPLLLGKDLYVSCYKSSLMQIKVDTGQPGWQVQNSSRHDLLFVDGLIIAIEDTTSAVSAFNAINGQRQWERTDLSYRRLSDPVYWRGQILLGDHEGYIHLLRPRDGLLVGRFRPFRTRVRSLLADGDRLYAVDEDGNVQAFRPATATARAP